MQYSLREQLIHGMRVSNLAYGLAKELGLTEDFCYEMAVAGMLHDIGKEMVSSALDEGENRLMWKKSIMFVFIPRQVVRF